MVSQHTRALPAFRTLMCALLTGLASAAAWAQSPAAPATAASAADLPKAPVLASTYTPPAGLPDKPPAPPANEPAATRTVVEDDNVRIEELKVRGQVQRITVHSKLRGVAPYQIMPPNASRDPAAPGQVAGQRLWSFDF